jgi:hypothetical protein
MGTDNPIAVEPEDARRIAMAGEPVISRILDERQRQNQLWGQQDHDDLRWVTTIPLDDPPRVIAREVRGEGGGGAILEHETRATHPASSKPLRTKFVEHGKAEVRRIHLLSTSSTELPLIGLLGSSSLWSWSFRKFASGRMATPGSTSLNGTFAGA